MHRVAVVTGASSGIGAATAIRLAGAGYHVIAAARRADRIEELAARIRADGGEAAAVYAGVAESYRGFEFCRAPIEASAIPQPSSRCPATRYRFADLPT